MTYLYCMTFLCICFYCRNYLYHNTSMTCLYCMHCLFCILGSCPCFCSVICVCDRIYLFYISVPRNPYDFPSDSLFYHLYSTFCDLSLSLILSILTKSFTYLDAPCVHIPVFLSSPLLAFWLALMMATCLN